MRINKKYKPIHKQNLDSSNRNYENSYSPLCNDPVEEERKSQQEEYKRRQNKDNSLLKIQPQQKKNNKLQSSALNLEENSERTWAWLADTFPHLFSPDHPAKPLDIHILRDIKSHYKNYKDQKRYPKDLMIKAALCHYMQQPEDLLCLQEGAFRYDIQGNEAGSVTKGEQEEASKLLKAITRKSQDQLLQLHAPNLEADGYFEPEKNI